MNRSSKIIEVPKWAWGSLAGLAGFVLLLSASYFCWLGMSVVAQGAGLSALRAQVNALNDNLCRLADTLGQYPSHRARVDQMEADVAKLRSELRNLALSTQQERERRP